MIAWQSLVVLALSASGDATLLEFSSQSCPACVAVQPVVQRLASEGYDVRQVDVEQEQDAARQYQVRAVPTFVVVRNGQEVGRVVGASTYDKLVQLMRAGATEQRLAPPPAGPSQANFQSRAGVENTDFRGLSAPPASNQAAAANSPVLRALHATVRLKVEDAGGFGYGTGTIVDRHEDEALVVTCGHIFRESQGKGKITADLFAPGAQGPVDGQLIAYDLDRDIALVSIRPNMAIEPVLVGGPSFVVKPHDAAFTIGCDKGADASVRETKITAVNKYRGAPNITAAGQPIDGRSGGGLFSADGVLIGVCNAADPADDEGLYAALASIQWQLDQIGQSEIYQRSEQPSVAGAMDSRLVPNDPGVPTLPERMPTRLDETPAPNALPVGMSAGPPEGSPAAALGAAAAPLNRAVGGGAIPAELGSAPAGADDMEMIVIVRSKSNPQRQSEVFVLDRANPALMQQLAASGRPAGIATTDVRQAALNAWDSGRTALRNQLGPQPIVRGQSGE